jgi:hypothetical protein
MIQDFLGNEIKIGDTVVCVMGKHLKKSTIEDIVVQPFGKTKEGYLIHQVKIKDLKEFIMSNKIMRI